LIAALTGIGAIVAIVLAVFGVRASMRSSAFSRRHSRPLQGRAQIGLVASSMAVMLAGISIFSFVSETQSYGPCTSRPIQVERIIDQPIEGRVEQPTPHYAPSDAARLEQERRMQRYREQNAEWQREADQRGYRYPVEPVATPVVPRNKFEWQQQEYSRKVREERSK
jgi:hypothetical protein